MLDYSVSGHGPRTIVLLHSLGSARAMWQPQMAALEAQFTVVAIDHLGHGTSPTPAGPYTMALLGESVIEVLDHLTIAQANIVGISMGGHLALWLGIHYPQRVSSIVAICTAASFGDPAGWDDRADIVLAQGTAALASSVADRWLTPAFASAHPELRQWIIDMVSATPDVGYAGCCAALGSSDITADLPHVAAPVLAIAAGKDPGTSVSNLELIARSVAHGQLYVVQDAAHLCNVEQPQEVTRVVLDFLQKVPLTQ